MKKIITLLTLALAFIFSSEAQTRINLRETSSGTLKGGISFKKYEGIGKVKVGSDPDMPPSTFIYDIAWPVSGPAEGVNAIRKKIVKTLIGDRKITLPQLSATNFPEIINSIVAAIVRDDKRDETFWTREYAVDLVSNGSAVTLDSYSVEDEWSSGNGEGESGRSVYRLSDGKELTKNMLPSWEKIRPLVCANFYNNDERQYDSPGGYGGQYNKNNLPEPKNLPVLYEDNISFIYGPYEIGSRADGVFQGRVDYSDIYNYASDELKTFFPKDAGKK